MEKLRGGMGLYRIAEVYTVTRYKAVKKGGQAV
jgi:hypothetical protein